MDSLTEKTNEQAAYETLSGGGEMGALMRSLDWAQTPLGAIATWPQSLRTAVSICLASNFPMLIWWGPELVMLYNDAYRPMLGTKHPHAMGQKGHDCWPEIWDIIGPMLEGVLNEGKATWSENQLLPLERNGYPEECYFTFSYSPIRDETGGIGGVFTAVTETTRQVIGDRRLRTLREMAARTAETRTVEAVCQASARALDNNTADIPFAFLYLLDESGKTAYLKETIGLPPDQQITPEVVELQSESQTSLFWPLASVVETGQMELVVDIQSHIQPFSAYFSQIIPHTAAVLPIVRAGQERPYGLLIAGISPYRAFDEEYQSFLELIAGQIATAVSGAMAYEEERKRAEALAELDQAKTVFFSNISHEFRTPLTLLLGPLEDALAHIDHASPTEQQERIEMAQRNALRLLKLVNTLLDFSRIEAGRMQAVYEPTDLATFTAELASMFRAAIDRAGLQFEIACPAISEPVYVDHDMWEKIVMNLLSNALKFTFEGHIRVSLQEHEECVVLEVSDTGAGIPEEELPNLFKRFHRIAGTRSRTHEGSGIGLALIHELVRLHDGSIRVISSEGKGSTFIVTIPKGTTHLPAEHVNRRETQKATALGAAPFVEEALRWLPQQEQRQGAAYIKSEWTEQHQYPHTYDQTQEQVSLPARILLADDNADMREYVTRLLSEHWSVEAAANGVEALEAIQKQLPDLLLTDIMMPEMDGFQLVQKLRSCPETATLPVIFLSARAGEEEAVEGLEAGADDYLVKPFSANELLARVSTHLTMARMRKQVTDKEREHASQLQQLAKAFIAINKTLSPEEIIWFITDQARTIIGTHQAITAYAGGTQGQREICAVSFSDKYADWRDYDVSNQIKDLHQHFQQSKKSLCMSQQELEDYQHHYESGQTAEERLPMRGLLAAPLLGRDGHVLGLLQLSDRYEGEFTEQDEAILVQLAQMSSVALENAVLYQRMQEALRARDELFSVVSHDLKNPLGAIKGFAQLLRRTIIRGKEIDREQFVEGLTKIDQTVTKMTKLINELLDLARLHMEQSAEVEYQPTDLVKLAQEVSNEYQQTTDMHTIICMPSSEELIGQWNTAQIERVLDNLVSNAIKYSPDGGEIIIKVWQEQKKDGPIAALSVEDQGMGIPEADLPQVFKQFHRGSNVTSEIKGTGIGLASARQIVENHKGTLAVQSQLGKGSIFTLHLPLTPGGRE